MMSMAQFNHSDRSAFGSCSSPGVARRLVGAAAVALLVSCGGDGSDAKPKVTTNESSQQTTPGSRLVEITGSNFAYTPSVITATPGEILTIHLTSMGNQHDLAVTIEGKSARVVIAKEGETIEGGWKVPDAPGTYELFCSIIGHKSEGMVGTLVIA
jgi:plastocyanin